jgi:tetratricopeptide (TPR) repeat protein
MPPNLRPLTALLLVVASIAASPAALANTEVRATVLSIGDGDTIRVHQCQQRITIRLACTDAPKTSQAPYGKQVAERSPELSPKVLEWVKQANAFQSQGAYGKAAQLWEQILGWSEKALGPDHSATATFLNNLAGLYYLQGAYAKAEPLFKRALAIREKVLGPDHPDTATFLNNLAELYYLQGAYTEAEPLFKRALAIYEKKLGPDHPNTATSLNNLAALYVNQSAYAKAEPLLKRALAIYEKALGPDHPDTVSTRDLLEQCRKALSN